MNNKQFDLKVGWSCNNKCIHCIVEDKKQVCGDTSLEDLKQIIDDNDNADTFIVTGGEATIRKDFFKILDHMNRKDKRIILQTNGRKFKDYNFALNTMEYVDEILIAIHSYSPEIHDATTQIKGSWEETALGLANLYNITKDDSRSITSQTVLNIANSKNLTTTFDFIQYMAPNINMNLTHPHPSGASLTNFKISVPKFENIKEELQQTLEKYAPLLFIEAIPKCYLHPYVDKVGAISWYTETERGGYDLSATVFNTIIDDYDLVIREELMKGPKCVDCIYNDECFGVWKDYIFGYQQELDLFPIKEK